MLREHYISPKYKIQSQPKQKKDGTYSAGVCVGYIDARDCQELLDKIYGPTNRQNEFYEVKDKTFCKIGVKCDGERVRKSDSGALSESDNVDKDVTSKGDSSDAFKRTCVMRGIGRYLYSLPTLWIKKEEYVANKYKINEFIRSKYSKELKERYEGLFKDA